MNPTVSLRDVVLEARQIASASAGRRAVGAVETPLDLAGALVGAVDPILMASGRAAEQGRSLVRQHERSGAISAPSRAALACPLASNANELGDGVASLANSLGVAVVVEVPGGVPVAANLGKPEMVWLGWIPDPASPGGRPGWTRRAIGRADALAELVRVAETADCRWLRRAANGLLERLPRGGGELRRSLIAVLRAA
jgi:hypothetical protein